MLRLLVLPLDAAEPRPRGWAAALAGAGCGLAWGVLARIWMRLIATTPAFTIAGTLFILAIPTIFGACAGLAFAARRRGWRGWRYSVPRGLAVCFFLPFGIAGGGPLMVTVLLAALAMFQRALVGAWVLAALVLLAALATDINPPALATAGAPAFAAVLLGWKLIVRGGRASPVLASADAWVERAVRAGLLLLAASGVVLVSREILADKPGPLGLVYVLAYLLLLAPLMIALRVALSPRAG